MQDGIFSLILKMLFFYSEKDFWVKLSLLPSFLIVTFRKNFGMTRSVDFCADLVIPAIFIFHLGHGMKLFSFCFFNKSSGIIKMEEFCSDLI